jgi:general nucleoside transport system permease protein
MTTEIESDGTPAAPDTTPAEPTSPTTSPAPEPGEATATSGRRVGAKLAKLGSVSETFSLYAVCIASALALSAILVEATGGSATEVFSALLDGSLRGPGRIGSSIGVAVPLLLVALGTIVSNRAGLVNIGQEGQVFLGAAFAAYVGAELAGPGPLVLVALLVAGVVGGAVWAGIAAALKYGRSVPEVLSTLLLVTVGTQLVGYGLKNQWLLLAPSEGRANRQQISEQLAPDTRLPRITWFGNEFPTSLFLALVIAAALAFVLARTVWGFRLQMLGQNPRTAHRAGVAAPKYGGAALVASGAFAGLAGAVMLAGGDFGNYTLVPGFPASIGWTGLLVALVARQRVSAAIIVAVVFACLRTGSGFLAATGVERRVTDVVQGLLVLALLIPPALLFLRQRRRQQSAAGAAT